VLALSAPAALAAGGGSATEQGYPGATAPGATGGNNGNSGNGVAGRGTRLGTTGTTRAGGTLPFTGAQLGMIVLAGVFLIGGGFVLRASGRNRSTSL
jgi:hypothetical protein